MSINDDPKTHKRVTEGKQTEYQKVMKKVKLVDANVYSTADDVKEMKNGMKEMKKQMAQISK